MKLLKFQISSVLFFFSVSAMALDSSTPLNSLGEETLLRIKTEIPAYPRKDATYIQGQKVLANVRALDKTAPYCWFHYQKTADRRSLLPGDGVRAEGASGGREVQFTLIYDWFVDYFFCDFIDPRANPTIEDFKKVTGGVVEIEETHRPLTAEILLGQLRVNQAVTSSPSVLAFLDSETLKQPPHDWPNGRYVEFVGIERTKTPPYWSSGKHFRILKFGVPGKLEYQFCSLVEINLNSNPLTVTKIEAPKKCVTVFGRGR